MKFRKRISFLNRSTVGIVDAEKLYLLAKRRHLETELERFMVKDIKEDLKHWVQKNKIPTKEIESCMKYVLNAGDIQMERGKMQVMACMVDPYGNPYIPGSSIKGMLRTILLCADIIQYPEKYRIERTSIKQDIQIPCNRKRVLSKNIEAIENKAFHTLKKSEKVNDIMAGLIIGDSDVLERKDIILCQKWDRHIDGKEGTINLCVNV
ncbi:MAG: type III-A CRISPR-associated RAMP protein Csm5 [Lachnospiraceae bacterium]